MGDLNNVNLDSQDEATEIGLINDNNGGNVKELILQIAISTK